MDYVDYIDKEGNRYTVALSLDTKKYQAVVVIPKSRCRRLDAIARHKEASKVQEALDSYAQKHDWLPYPTVVCDSCAKASGKTWPDGHIATFYPGICGVCGIMSTVTEPRDWGHFNTTEELKALYQVALNGELYDENGRRKEASPVRKQETV